MARSANVGSEHGAGLAGLATLQSHSHNPTFTSSSDEAERLERSLGMEDEASRAPTATAEAFS